MRFSVALDTFDPAGEDEVGFVQPYHLPKVVASVVAERTLAARQAHGLLEIRP